MSSLHPPLPRVPFSVCFLVAGRGQGCLLNTTYPIFTPAFTKRLNGKPAVWSGAPHFPGGSGPRGLGVALDSWAPAVLLSCGCRDWCFGVSKPGGGTSEGQPGAANSPCLSAGKKPRLTPAAWGPSSWPVSSSLLMGCPGGGGQVPGSGETAKSRPGGRDEAKAF